MRQVSQWLLDWGYHEIWIVYIFWSAYVRGRRIVFCEFFFQIFFRNTFLKKFAGISSGNSHLLSSALEMILTFLWTTESSSSLSDLEEELDDWHGEDGSFWLSPFLLWFFLVPYLWSLYCLGIGLNNFYWVYYFCAVRRPL